MVGACVYSGGDGGYGGVHEGFNGHYCWNRGEWDGDCAALDSGGKREDKILTY